eukprot:GSMAST32.ASY1.ANO1.1587.1 assembled CDS
MPRQGSKRKKTRTHVVSDTSKIESIPRSFVVKQGHCGRGIQCLVRDMRQVMMPHTAASLKESRKAKIKDYVAIAGPIGVSHLLMFAQTPDGNSSLRVGTFPRGPTCWYSVQNYSLMKSVHGITKRPMSQKGLYQTPPLVVINNFDVKKPHQKLATLTWQSLFPALNVADLRLSSCRRVVLLDYDKKTDLIKFQAQIPNMRGAKDISELLLGGGGGGGSDSEFEDETWNIDGNQSAVRLVELGPRMNLKLVKIEQELCAGEVMYHAYKTKSVEEKTALRTKAMEKKQRREQQNENVKRKREAEAAKIAAKKQRRDEKMKLKETKKKSSDINAETEETEESILEWSNDEDE